MRWSAAPSLGLKAEGLGGKISLARVAYSVNAHGAIALVAMGEAHGMV